ncbi:hypothetical protein [Clostridium sp. B9]|uniref:hypothetical protein n=1 Tax=Clostridium sp. B9 TaxID=3423224 RepID=UPI003D2EF351
MSLGSILEGQVSVFDIVEDIKKETLQDKMKKQLKKAIQKGIVPGAKVFFDKDVENIYVVSYLYCGSGEVLEVRLRSISGGSSEPCNALSDRLTVIE